RAEHPRPDDRPQVQGVAQREHGVARAVQIAHGRHAPGDIASGRPPFDVRMRINQPRHYRLPDETDALGAPRHRDFVDTRNRFDVTVADDDEGILFRRAAGAVDQRRALERDDAVLGDEPIAPRQQYEQKYRADVPTCDGHFVSADV